MTNSRSKGKRGELELSKALTELLGTTCRRGQQYCGIEGQDVVGIAGVHIECKRVESLNINTAIDQACRDAGENVPIVCHRRSRRPWLVTLRLEDLLRFVEVFK